MPRSTSIPYFAIAFLALAAPAAFGIPKTQAVDCLSCHGDKDLKDQADHSVYVDEAKKKASVHGSLGCTDCHTSIKDYPHPDHLQPVDCGTCHADAIQDVKGSVHASVSAQPCLGCHGEPHAILPASNPQSNLYPLNVPRTCGSCHGNPEIAKRYNLPNVYPLYLDSIHGFALTKDGLLVAATCSSCHGTHKILSRKDPHSRTSPANIPSTCGTCHAGSKAEYLAGVHGKALERGNGAAPVCTDCHTAHQISNVREVAWQGTTSATCGNCHKDRFATYLDTFHSQVSALGYTQTAHCWDCHGNHEILPASDPKSPVAKANLVATCSKCHAGATKSFVTYQPHANSHDFKAYPLVYLTGLFMNLLLASVLGFFALHTMLWFIRASSERRANHAAPKSGESH